MFASSCGLIDISLLSLYGGAKTFPIYWGRYPTIFTVLLSSWAVRKVCNKFQRAAKCLASQISSLLGPCANRKPSANSQQKMGSKESLNCTVIDLAKQEETTNLAHKYSPAILIWQTHKRPLAIQEIDCDFSNIFWDPVPFWCSSYIHYVNFRSSRFHVY